jgi:arginase
LFRLNRPAKWANLHIDPCDEFDRIRTISEAVFRRGRKPLFIGGDHSVTYPIIDGLHAAIGAPSIIYFDAHADLYDASPFARIIERGLAKDPTQPAMS